MAEIASAYPTAGGLYYWASRMQEQELGLVDRLVQPASARFSIVAGINYVAAQFLNVSIVAPILATRHHYGDVDRADQDRRRPS